MPLELLKSHFSGWRQVVRYGGVTALVTPQELGVIQGSLNGSLFFYNYSNDINYWLFTNYGYADPSPPSQKWSDLYERCGISWIEWKTKYIFICEFYFSSYGGKFIENWGHFEHKKDHNSKNKNHIKSEIWFFFLLNLFRIFHLNLNTFEKKKLEIFVHVNYWV